MKYTKILLPLNEKHYNSNLHEITIQIFLKLVNMGLSANFHLMNFFHLIEINSNTYLLTL
jgi:hypothetical protein